MIVSLGPHSCILLTQRNKCSAHGLGTCILYCTMALVYYIEGQYEAVSSKYCSPCRLGSRRAQDLHIHVVQHSQRGRNLEPWEVQVAGQQEVSCCPSIDGGQALPFLSMFQGADAEYCDESTLGIGFNFAGSHAFKANLEELRQAALKHQELPLFFWWLWY